MTSTPQRGSRTSSPTRYDSSPTRNDFSPTLKHDDALVTDERRPFPSTSLKPATKPTSPPEEGQITRPSNKGNREHGRYSGRGGSNSVNFLKKNRQACKKCENFTGVPRIAGEPSKEAMLVFPPRTKLGLPPVIGDELGTSSTYGSSFFMGPGHYGVREPLPKKTVKKRSDNNKSDSE